ncbi:hypothetical protein ACIRQQ_09090 [Streptomyces fuscichromogenes]|uniref:hypothetical protein n=1 Tax=Streptomyces fuscichromogenes TaxID=1324013 RepID=UPI00382FE23F
MRSMSLPRAVLVTALGCVLLSGCGEQRSAADQTPAGGGGAVPAASPSDASSSVGGPEVRLLALLTRVERSCAPDRPGDEGSGGVPEPEDLPGWEGAASPGYGPGETPSGVPNAAGDIPVSVAGPTPRTTTAPDLAEPEPAEEVALTGVEECAGGRHAQRIGEAFEGVRTTGYRAMRQRLADLDYPESRIHRMPDRAGAPRARLDLRVIGSHLALEVSEAGGSVTVEAFGAPGTEGVSVTDVQRRPKEGEGEEKQQRGPGLEPDAPAS